MNRYTIFIGVFACLFILGCAAKPLLEPFQNGHIQEAREVEAVVEGKGRGYNTEDAVMDARRSAVWVIVEGGTDPLLQTPEEKARFSPVQEEFYSPEMLNRFITDETKGISERIELESGIIQITKGFTVNSRLVREELVRREILEDLPPILPTIMVIPEVPQGQNPVATMANDPTLKHAAQVIEGFLTNRRYDVKVPEQQITIDGLVEAQSAIKGLAEDYSYQLALAIGSDVYVTFTLDIQNENVGGSTVRQVTAGVRSYETTTANLLGTETGYSKKRPESDLVLIEEAIVKGGAADKVLSRINAYWKEQLKRGVQYKLVVQIQGNFDSDEREDIGSAMYRVVQKNSKFLKENIVTDQTMDYQVWVDWEQMTSSRDVYEALRRDFPVDFPEGKLSRINITGKLILAQITENGN